MEKLNSVLETRFLSFFDISDHNKILLFLVVQVGHGDVLNINCSDNYEVEHEGEPVSCINGNWSQTPECFPARYATVLSISFD